MSPIPNSSSDPRPPLYSKEEREEEMQIEEQDIEPLMEETEAEAGDIQQEPEEAAFAEAAPEEHDRQQQEDAVVDAGARSPDAMVHWWNHYQNTHGVHARLFIGNLPTGLSEPEFGELLREFRQFGPSNGRMHGGRLYTAFVQYQNTQDAANALAASQENSARFISRGRVVRVEWAVGRRRHQLASYPPAPVMPAPQRYFYPPPPPPNPWVFNGQPGFQPTQSGPMYTPPQGYMNPNPYQAAYGMGATGNYFLPPNPTGYQGNGNVPYPPANSKYGNWGTGGNFAPAYDMGGYQGNGYVPYPPANPNYGNWGNEGYNVPSYPMAGWQENGHGPSYPAPDPNSGNGENHQSQDPNTEQQ